MRWHVPLILVYKPRLHRMTMITKLKLLPGIMLLLFTATATYAQQTKTYTIKSPDQQLSIQVEAGKKLQWQVHLNGKTIIAPSEASMKLAEKQTFGENMVIQSIRIDDVDTKFDAHFYKKKSVKDQYQQLTLNIKGDYGVIFRAYNDGVAYRFFSTKKNDFTVVSENANFNFEKDYKAFVPYVNDPRAPGDSFITSFEALYDEHPISGFLKDSLAFSPLLVDLENGVKAALIEAHLENYPGMMYLKSSAAYGLKGAFAAYPLAYKAGGHNMLNQLVTKRANYIAKVKGATSFPWRGLIISKQDTELLNNDMIQKLAAPNRIKDISWIKPGKVAWDWWNNWNISNVDFRAGINTEAYKYYIDFAVANKLEYIIMDEGWSNSVDLQQINPKIEVEEIVKYAKSKNIGVILWASWRAVDADMEAAFAKYAKMGVKGFKIDFLDRDDQVMTNSTYQIAAAGAKHKLLIDLHGVFKPEGLQRTYPNVINYEGVKGLENSKWADGNDVPRYDVTIPFVRMLAGPLDYTPGAMRNAVKANYRAINDNPMSQGTRAHQVAMYVIYEAPLQMLADNPTAYYKEQETTTFISKVPTVFDETVALAGEVAEYVALARRSGQIWHVGAMTNWTARDLDIDLSFIPAGNYEAEIFQDGINADREATDYKVRKIKVKKGDKIKAQLSTGGGWAARIYPVK
jgi:alpha-glucosidase